MENVIIGKLIPAGSGFAGSKKFEMIEYQNTVQKSTVEKSMIGLQELG
jgi:hypothetical protein